MIYLSLKNPFAISKAFMEWTIPALGMIRKSISMISFSVHPNLKEPLMILRIAHKNALCQSVHELNMNKEYFE